MAEFFGTDNDCPRAGERPGHVPLTDPSAILDRRHSLQRVNAQGHQNAQS